VRFFRDAQKLAAVVLAQLDVKILPFDLQLLRVDDVIHFLRPEKKYNGTLLMEDNSPEAAPDCATTRLAIAPAFATTLFSLTWRAPIRFIIGNREVDLALEHIDPRDIDAQLVAD